MGQCAEPWWRGSLRADAWRAKVFALTAPVSFAAVLLCLLTGCDSDERESIDLTDTVTGAELRQMTPAPDPDALRFGFDLRASPEEDARQYLPLLEYLARTTGLHFELRFTPKGSNMADDLGTGVVQFAAIGADTYIQARARHGVLPVVRGLNAEGRAEYQSVIVTAVGSPLETIADLRGKRFAFGSLTSTQGHLIPRIVLAEHGILLEDLAGYEHTGSHRNCANAVAAGRFDAGGMQDTMGRRMAKQGLIRILYTSPFYPSSGIAANRDVPADTVAKVKQALLEFDPAGRDAAGLYHWDQTEMPKGFSEARDEDYAELRKWSLRFGLVDVPGDGREP